jgi:hypothetical protein
VRSMGARVATTVWTVAPELVLALDERLGTPLDSYVNGSQTWLTTAGGTGTDDDDDDGIGLEWRLHPVAGYRPPAGISLYELWEQVVSALSQGADPAAIALGDETRPLTSLWDGLECYAPYDDLEPVALAQFATERLGRAPDRSGLVDHQAIGDAWEQSNGGVSLVALLIEQLAN